MRRFQFKFQAVETVRKSKENEALRALASAQAALNAAHAHKNQLIDDLDRALRRREALGSAPALALQYQLETEFIEGTKIRALQADQGIQRAAKAYEKALRAYLYARRQTRMMEILREKAEAEYKRERAKAEQREQDDLYVMRARMAKEVA